MVSLPAPASMMLPPPTPLAKKSSNGLKRNSSYVDADVETALSMSSKKLKVAFDDHVDVRIMDDWNDKSYELVKEEVYTGIERHLAPAEQRNDLQYAKLVQLLGQDVFSSEALRPELLKKYVVALNSTVIALGDCGKLVMAALDLSWLGRDEEFIQIYTRFVLALATAHGKFIVPIVERIVSLFERLPVSTGRLPGESIFPRSMLLQRLHGMLQILLRHLPSAGGVLLRVVKQQFPYDAATTKGHLRYQRQLLRIAGAVPQLKTELLALIIQRHVEIDVQIQQDLEDLEDEEEETIFQQPRHVDNKGKAEESDDSDMDSASESELTITEEELRIRELRIKVAKLDQTQDLLFEYYEPCFKTGQTPIENEAYQDLIAQFTSFVMPCRSRHAQFLLFHFAQFSPAYANDFVQQCLRTLLDRTAAHNTRLTACAYVASFTARGSHIPSATVRVVFQVLNQFMEQMRRQYEPHCLGPNRKAYSTYYAVAQALMYIFCFRWRDLVVGLASPEREDEQLQEEDVLDEGRDLVWLPGIKDVLHMNVQSFLNPLKVCSAAIVTEFARIANHLRFLYVFTILERNKRVRLGQISHSYGQRGELDVGRRETAWDRKSGDAHHQLDAYFPFDPYHLPKSKRWLEGEYNEWKLPRGMQLDNEDVEDGESEEDNDYQSDEDLRVDESSEPPFLDAISVSS